MSETLDLKLELVKSCIGVQTLDQDAIKKVLDGGDKMSLLYGETPLESFSSIIYAVNQSLEEASLDTLKGDGTETFIDIGSGRGHVVFASAANCHWKKCVGIELEGAHVKEAEKAKEKLKDFEKQQSALATKAEAIEFIEADAIKDSTVFPLLQQATFIYCFDMAFPSQLRVALAHSLSNNLSDGALVVSTHLNRFPSAAFYPVGPMFSIMMEWGAAPAQLYRKGSGAFEAWLPSHEAQLDSAGVPRALWESACTKLIEESLDIGSKVQFAQIEAENTKDLVLIAKEKIEKESEVFVIDHCWSFASLSDAYASLEKIPGLKDRILSMCPTQQESEELTSAVVERAKSLLASYTVISDPSKPEEQTTIYYMLDEIGSRMRRQTSGKIGDMHEALSANFKIVPIFSFAQRMSFSLAFPIRDIQVDEVLIADHEQGWDMEKQVDIIQSNGEGLMPEMKEFSAQAALTSLIEQEKKIQDEDP